MRNGSSGFMARHGELVSGNSQRLAIVAAQNYTVCLIVWTPFDTAAQLTSPEQFPM